MFLYISKVIFTIVHRKNDLYIVALAPLNLTVLFYLAGRLRPWPDY